MKLIIRDEKPKEPEETVEIWLEKHYGKDTICVMSKKIGQQNEKIEAHLNSDSTINLIFNGNFEHV